MTAESTEPYQIELEIETTYVPDQSSPTDEQYVFAYTITIMNRGNVAAQLLSRHWLITDANGKEQEVRGDGVVGEQPHLEPGEGFSYTSAAMIATPVGSMQGSYQMIADDGTSFDVEIPAFTLALPHTIH